MVCGEGEGEGEEGRVRGEVDRDKLAVVLSLLVSLTSLTRFRLSSHSSLSSSVSVKGLTLPLLLLLMMSSLMSLSSSALPAQRSEFGCDALLPSTLASSEGVGLLDKLLWPVRVLPGLVWLAGLTCAWFAVCLPGRRAACCSSLRPPVVAFGTGL